MMEARGAQEAAPAAARPCLDDVRAGGLQDDTGAAGALGEQGTTLVQGHYGRPSGAIPGPGVG
jgi:hypothetical protein